MLLAVPDAISCPPGGESCTPQNASSTSYDNRFFDNRMGRAPGGRVKRNGVDFWWDEFPGNTGNCWFNNSGPDGSNGSWTGDPPRFPTPNESVPGFLPENCGSPGTAGTGDPEKEAVLVECAAVAIGDPSCEWYQEPAKPGSSQAERQAERNRQHAKALLAQEQLTAPQCSLVSDTLSCAAYANRP